MSAVQRQANGQPLSEALYSSCQTLPVSCVSLAAIVLGGFLAM